MIRLGDLHEAGILRLVLSKYNLCVGLASTLPSYVYRVGAVCRLIKLKSEIFIFDLNRIQFILSLVLFLLQ